MAPPEHLRDATPSARLGTGWEALDELLGGGWPVGCLVEVRGRGRTSLGLGAVRRAQEQGRPVAWIDGQGTFCAATAEIDPEALTVVEAVVPAAAPAPRPAPRRAARPAAPAGVESVEPADAGPELTEAAGESPAPGRRGRRRRSPAARALFAADVLLRSRGYGLLVLDLPGRAGPAAAWFRLARLAERADCGLLLVHDGGRFLAGSAASVLAQVRLRAEPFPAWGHVPRPALELCLRRHRGAPGLTGRRLVLEP